VDELALIRDTISLAFVDRTFVNSQIRRAGVQKKRHGALYSVTYSWLSKSDNNIDVPLARPVRAASITSAR
jgi:hypothetical protein